MEPYRRRVKTVLKEGGVTGKLVPCSASLTLCSRLERRRRMSAALAAVNAGRTAADAP